MIFPAEGPALARVMLRDMRRMLGKIIVRDLERHGRVLPRTARYAWKLSEFEAREEARS